MEYTLAEIMVYSNEELRRLIKSYPLRASLYKSIMRARLEHARCERMEECNY
jgi:hypothetical protein